MQSFRGHLCSVQKSLGEDDPFELTGHKISYLSEAVPHPSLPVLATELLCVLSREEYPVSDKMDILMQEFCLQDWE